jgi:hypothetical protein
MQFQAPLAMKGYAATPLSKCREGAARPQRPPTKTGPRRGPLVNSCTIRGPQGPEQGKHVPEVGLELHSSPCKHWTPAKSSAIWPGPAPVRPGPKPRVCTLCTPSLFALRQPKKPETAEIRRLAGAEHARRSWCRFRPVVTVGHTPGATYIFPRFRFACSLSRRSSPLAR